MNTFLPFQDFVLSASVLDDKRLNKQILEAHQLLLGQWPNHPCSKMWNGYKGSLIHYYNSCLFQWKEIRNKNHKFNYIPSDDDKWPSWINNPLVFFTHKVNLLRKDFDWYSKQFVDPFIFENLHSFPEGYYWPVGPLGKRGQEHSDNWIKWANNNKRNYGD